MERHPTGLVVILVVTGLLVSGCSAGDPRELPGDLHQSLVAAETSPKMAPTGDPFPGNADMHVVQTIGTIPARWTPSRWIAVGVDRNAAKVQILWGRGACEKKDLQVDVYVDERPDSVVIDVSDDPTMDLPPGTSCSLVSLETTYSVSLKAPIGSRQLMEHEISSR